MGKKVTMQQIANYLGVSIYVVSRALSGKSGVKSETKEKVFQTASQLGYFAHSSIDIKPNPDIEHTEVEEKNNVLVVMPDIRNQQQDSIFWGSIINGLSESLEQSNLRMIILTTSNTKDVLDILKPSKFMGLIGVGKVSTNLILEVKRYNMPVILIDHEDEIYPTDSIFANNFDSSYSLANYLIGIGHMKMQFLGNINYSRSFFDRWLGFRTALEKSGLNYRNQDFSLLKADSTDSMFIDIKEWLKNHHQKGTLPSALFCANDSIAVYVYSLMNEIGLKIPEDISITGFDNIKDSYLLTPTLTTVNIPKEDLGKRAVKSLLRRTEDINSPLEKVIISSELILRESVRPLK